MSPSGHRVHYAPSIACTAPPINVLMCHSSRLICSSVHRVGPSGLVRETTIAGTAVLAGTTTSPTTSAARSLSPRITYTPPCHGLLAYIGDSPNNIRAQRYTVPASCASRKALSSSTETPSRTRLLGLGLIQYGCVNGCPQMLSTQMSSTSVAATTLASPTIAVNRPAWTPATCCEWFLCVRNSLELSSGC